MNTRLNKRSHVSLALRRRTAPLWRAVVAVTVILALLAPSVAWAATPYNIAWVHGEFYNDVRRSCEGVQPDHSRGAFFTVNAVPIAATTDQSSLITYANGDQRINVNAPFQSVLLSPGSNAFTFAATITTGDNSCVESAEYVTLTSPVLSAPKLLFDVDRHGTAFTGTTQLALSLNEINPPLARDLANLEDAISRERASLVANASRVADLAGRLDALQQLQTELSDLARRGLDEISTTDLDAILNRYTGVVDPATKAALDQFLADLKKSVDDLRTELGRLMASFGTLADETADFATKTARENGWDAENLANYGANSPAVDIPSVDVPEFSTTPGVFDPANDPYSAYAERILARLQETITSGIVVERPEFVTIVRAWRENQRALERALRARAGTSQAETAAFLTAQNRVSAFVRQHMDQSDWFIQNPIPPNVRRLIDGVITQKFAEIAATLKDRLNEWQSLTAERQLLIDTLEGFGSGMEAAPDDDDDSWEDGDTRRIVGNVLSGVATAARFGIGFVPIAGDVIDACEAITGREACNPNAPQLSWSDRFASGMGLMIGSGAFWRHVGGSAVVAAAIVVPELAAKIKRYRLTFFLRHPGLKGKVWVHHAIEQQAFRDYAGLFTEAEIHAYENLRGIPKEVNSEIHLSNIRIIWNRFYKQHPPGSGVTRQMFLDKVREIDQLFGSKFLPPR